MDEVEDGLQFRTPVQRGAAAGLGPDHGAAGGLEGLDLGVQGLVRGRDPSIADPRSETVHFGCACDMMCSLTRNGPKVNRKTGRFSVHFYRHSGFTHNDASGGQSVEIDPGVQIDVVSAIGVDVGVDQRGQTAKIFR